MIEILILHALSDCVHTMYGLKKRIGNEFAPFMVPSLGTIRPALMRLEKKGYVSLQKNMSKGGRPSVYYSITAKGRAGIEDYLLSPISENPIQFLNIARIRLYCSDCLDKDKRKELIEIIKSKADGIYCKSKEFSEKKGLEFYPRIIVDNLNCEYKNFISLLEGLVRAGNY